MRGSDLAEGMALAVDRIVSAREGTGALDRAIEAVVSTIGRFSGKDATIFGVLPGRNVDEGYSGREASCRIPASGDAGHPFGGARGPGGEPDLGGVRRSAPREVRAG